MKSREVRRFEEIIADISRELYLKEQLGNSIMFSRKFIEPPGRAHGTRWLRSNGSIYQLLKPKWSSRRGGLLDMKLNRAALCGPRPLIYTSAARRNFVNPVNSRRTSDTDRDPLGIAVREGGFSPLGRSLVSRLTDPDTGRSRSTAGRMSACRSIR